MTSKENRVYALPLSKEELDTLAEIVEHAIMDSIEAERITKLAKIQEAIQRVRDFDQTLYGEI